MSDICDARPFSVSRRELSMPEKYIKQKDVPESMLGGLPWGEPFKRWTTSMLERALDGGHVDDSPKIAAAITAEKGARG